MLKNRAPVVLTIVVSLIGIAAGRQLAMLVEWTPLRATGEGVLTEVLVHVAPEDRGALGKDVMVWAELSRKDERILRRGWALKIDDPNAPLRIEIVIPEGPHVLRIDLEGAAARSNGVWWGDVDVSSPDPDSDSPGEPVLTQSPEGASAAGAAAEAAVGTTSKSTAETAKDDAAPDAEDPESAVGAFRPHEPEADGSRVVNDPSTDLGGDLGADGIAGEARQAHRKEPETAPASGTGTVAVAGAATGAAVGTVSKSTAETAKDDAAPDAQDPESVGGAFKPRDPEADGSRVVNDPSTDLGGDLGADGSEGASQTDDDSSFGVVTIAATRQGRPVTDLSQRDLEVRVGRDIVEVSTISGPSEAPLGLGFAVDLAPQNTADQAWVGGMLERLAGRADGDHDRVFVDDRGGSTSGWGLEPSRVAETVARRSDGGGDLPTLVGVALARFSMLRDRAYLVLMTDGRGPRSRDGWKETIRSAQNAGVPILVAGIWHKDFGSGLRKDLRRLADASGGAVFYLQGATQIEDLLERFGSVIDGSYAVVVDAPRGTGAVSVAAGDPEIVIRSATVVR